MSKDHNTLRTWIDIDTEAIKHNVGLFRQVLKPSTRMLGVVKSNAYGHELGGFGRELQKSKIDFLGVDSAVEGRALRRQRLKLPILVLGYTLPANFGMAAATKLSLTVSSFESLKALESQQRKISIHLKVDTGMHRQGFFVSDVPKVLKKLHSLRNVSVEGVYTHFASAKDPQKRKETEKQIMLFSEAAAFVKRQYPGAFVHAAATAGTLNFPESHFDMVRVGIGLYGLWPSEETERAFSSRMALCPVLTWKTLVSELKWLEKGEKIGYDYTEKTSRKTLLAILPVGYWHGYFRSLSSRGFVLVGGKLCKVMGRVAMDMVAIDATPVSSTVRVGDEVVLIGHQGVSQISAQDIADLSGTTTYEFITRINPLIHKFYH